MGLFKVSQYYKQITGTHLQQNTQMVSHQYADADVSSADHSDGTTCRMPGSHRRTDAHLQEQRERVTACLPSFALW